MNLYAALQLVYDLAKENSIYPNDFIGDEELYKEALRQQDALVTVYDFIENEVLPKKEE